MDTDTIAKVKRQLSSLEEKKFFTSYISDRGLLSRIYKELKTLHPENNPIKKWGIELNRNSQKMEHKQLRNNVQHP